MAELRLSAIAIPGLSALLGGAVGALLTVTLVRDSASRTEARARPEPPTQADQPPTQSPVEERLASLERSLRALALKDGVARAAATPVGSAARDADSPPVTDVAPIVDNP